MEQPGNGTAKELAPGEVRGLRERIRAGGRRVQEFRRKHELAEVAGFFLAGFIVDALTLRRIDDLVILVKQGAYLALLGGLLVLDQRKERGAGLPAPLAKLLSFSEKAIHFLFGSLLSAYTLFYFKSASGVASLLFLAVMFGVLVANELPRFRRLGPVARFSLFGFALTSYFAYLLPVALGFLSPWLFVLAAVLSSLTTYGLFLWMRRGWESDSARAALRHVWLPAAAVQLALVGLYFARAIPPVPLSVRFIGIYHRVERTPDGYRLERERAEGRPWYRGDQIFRARPGDRVYVFARIFAPNKFADHVYLRWWYDDPRRGWISTDRIPLRISGGRAEGYRGYAFKERYQPGRWRVDVETEDEREIGRVHVTIEPDARLQGVADPTQAPERVFQLERG